MPKKTPKKTKKAIASRALTDIETRYLDDLSSAARLCAELRALQNKINGLRQNFDLSELIRYYHLVAITLADLLEKKEAERKNLSIRLEEFTIPSKALAVSPETQQAEFESKLEKAQAESEARLQRLQTDFDNYRKRAEKQGDDLLYRGAEQLMIKLLPVLDNFDRALSFDGASDAPSVLEGIRLIRKQLEETLAREGLQAIPSHGTVFDPQVHEAAERLPSGEFPDDTVVEEIRKGYRFKEKVIRPALVKVAKAETSNPGEKQSE